MSRKPKAVILSVIFVVFVGSHDMILLKAVSLSHHFMLHIQTCKYNSKTKTYTATVEISIYWVNLLAFVQAVFTI